MKNVEVVVDYPTEHGLIERTLIFDGTEKGIGITDNGQGKLVISTCSDDNVWQPIAVFNSRCRKYYRVRDTSDNKEA